MTPSQPTLIEALNTPTYSPGLPLEAFEESKIPASLKFRSHDGIRHAWEPVLVVHPKDYTSGYFRGPLLQVLPDGTWLCGMLTGGQTEPRPDNHLAVVQSADEGRTWSRPIRHFANERRRTIPGAPVQIGDRVGLILNTATEGAYYMEQRALISWIDPESRRWTVPEMLPGVPNAHAMPGFVAADGTSAWPGFWAEGCEQITPGDLGKDRLGWHTEWPGGLQQDAPIECRHVCGVIVTTDQGRSFRLRGHVSLPGVSLWEPTVAEVEPGHWVMLMRAESTGFLYRTESRDSGHNWSVAETTDIPNPSTKPFLMKVGEAILLFHNPNPGVGFFQRKQLELWISRDGMNTWENKIPLANAIGSDRPVCYPHALYLPKSHEIALVMDTARSVHLQRIPCSEIGLERP